MGTKTYTVGDEITGPRKVATEPRIFWYGSGFMSANAGERRSVVTSIHTDDEFAQKQGLPAAVADGMMSANWINSLLVAEFGGDYISRGHLATKFIKPVYVNEAMTSKARVTAITVDGATTTLELEVWCEDDEGVKRTVGAAHVGLGG